MSSTSSAQSRSVADRVTLICCDCGDRFFVEPRYSWKTLCRHCYLGEVKAIKRVKELETLLADIRKSGFGYIAIDRKRWRQLVQLTHPDRHAGSTTATDVTQWLNSIRVKVDA